MQTASTQATKVKFATQADPDVLSELRKLAGEEGKQLQTLVDEALREYLERKRGTAPRKHVVQALQASLAQYDSLYRELAK